MCQGARVHRHQWRRSGARAQGAYFVALVILVLSLAAAVVFARREGRDRDAGASAWTDKCAQGQLDVSVSCP